jgi:hypothetical protein
MQKYHNSSVFITCKGEKTRAPLALWCGTTSEGNETENCIFKNVTEKENTIYDVM